MKQLNRKAQAATEFIMTYGWAILVVLIAIGALAYFGVLSPDKFLPERCTFPAGIDCIDKAVITASTGQVELALKNNIGYTINVTSVITGTDDCPSPVLLLVNSQNVSTGNHSTIFNNDQATLRISCGNSLPVGKFKTDFGIEYLNMETKLLHKGSGSIRGRAT